MLVVFSCIILKEPFTARKAIAIVASFLGVVVLMAGNNEAFGGNPVKGAVACVVAAVSYGLFSVLNKQNDLDQDISMTVYWGVLTVTALVIGLIQGDWVLPDLTTWLVLAWLGIFANAVGYLIWALALNRSKNSARIANMAYLVPVLSMLLSALLLHEAIHWNAIVALALILGGILLQSATRQPKE